MIRLLIGYGVITFVAYLAMRKVPYEHHRKNYSFFDVDRD